ncbi:TorF family putative porin [Ensifer sp.]|jgi:uncharacterized protein (TIGR02001 family)|uniref:TorF family putative porin n=1 Tax=Ensifer sp. TaxID=1872086 RepID=UPI002E0FB366|nr:TorF family putative porin [Ensifer sp.]
MLRARIPLAVVASITCSTSSSAEDKVEIETAPLAAEDSLFDVTFGLAFVSDYISEGVSLTENRPALQGYVEATYDIFYAGTWLSNIRTDGIADTEIDLYAGIRPTFGDLSLGFGYTHYYYPKDPTDYGELNATASYAFTERFSAGGSYYHDIFVDTDWLEANASLKDLPFELEASGTLGTDFGSYGFEIHDIAWDLGVSRTFADTMTVDLRYYDSTVDHGRVVLKLSFDTSWSAMRGSE